MASSSTMPNQPSGLRVIPVDLLPITQRNAVSSPLLRLPAEVRHTIWEYIFTTDQISLSFPNIGKRHRLWRQSRDNMDEDSKKIKGVCNLDNPEGSSYSPYCMPAVCRQIYVETEHIIFELNTFQIEDGSRLSAEESMRIVSAHPVLCNIQSLYVAGLSATTTFDYQIVNGKAVDPDGKPFLTSVPEHKPFYARYFPKLKNLVLTEDEYMHLWMDITGLDEPTPEELVDKFRALFERRIREKEGKVSLEIT